MTRGRVRTWKPGLTIGGKYTLLRALGEGGRGAVFEAQNAWTGRTVAIKVMRPELEGGEEDAERFLAEARMAARVQHPNIVDILDMGEDPTDGSLYLVQELLRGKELRARLDERGHLDAPEALALLVPVMGALEATHAAGVVHRDVKPENIFLSTNSAGEVVPKLIDFGISKSLHGGLGSGSKRAKTRSGIVVGTPYYMSPEQALGSPYVNAQTDVWSLCVVLYEALCGERPFEATSAAALMAQILRDSPAPLERKAPWLSRRLCAVVERGLQRDRAQRWPTMTALREALLEAFETPEPPTAEALPAAPAEEHDTLRPPPFDEDMPEVVFEEVDVPEVLEGGSAEWGAASAEYAASGERLAAQVQVANEALTVNALEDALRYADRALTRARGDAAGELRLVRAEALNWQGRALEAEHAAAEALASLAPYREPWFRALGELATACARRGAFERLAQQLDALYELLEQGDQSAPLLALFFRVAVELGASSMVERADAVLERVGPLAQAHTEPAVLAWWFEARAAQRLRAGDPSGALDLWQRSVEHFFEAGDARNACLQRASMAQAYLELGEWKLAEEAARAVYEAARAMKLYFAPLAASECALAASRQRRSAEAEPLAAEAVDTLRDRGNVRLLALARVNHGLVLLELGRHEEAEQEARAALEVASPLPSLRLYAMSLLAEVLLRCGKAQKALTVAQKGVLALSAMEGAPGEAQLRLTYVEALAAMGFAEQSVEAARVAARRLEERAARLHDPAHRERFLGAIAEHQRTFALARG